MWEKSHKSTKIRVSSVYYSRGSGGAWGHPVLACAYAGYLNPKLEVEVRETWLRYRSGDASLADEILQRAAPEANEWAGTRALARATRNGYTSALKSHGVDRPIDFAVCTNETYLSLFDGDAKTLKRNRNLPKSANLRDAMTTPELTYVMAAESLASERIDEMECDGAQECRTATRKSASYIRQAIESDRADRQRQKQLF